MSPTQVPEAAVQVPDPADQVLDQADPDPAFSDLADMVDPDLDLAAPDLAAPDLAAPDPDLEDPDPADPDPDLEDPDLVDPDPADPAASTAREQAPASSAATSADLAHPRRSCTSPATWAATNSTDHRATSGATQVGREVGRDPSTH